MSCIHLFDGVLVNEVVVVFVQGTVEGDTVRLEQQVLGRGRVRMINKFMMIRMIKTLKIVRMFMIIMIISIVQHPPAVYKPSPVPNSSQYHREGKGRRISR